MSKQLSITVGGKHLVGKKLYVTDAEQKHRRAKKAYLTVDGVHHLCYTSDGKVSELSITYTGTMVDAGVVTMKDGDYRLLTLTSSGSLTVDYEVNAEVCLCGGGANGCSGELYDTAGAGGVGAYMKTDNVVLTGTKSAIVGAAQGSSSFAGVSSGTVYYWSTSGGSGGGGGRNSAARTGDGLNKYPFGDTEYFKYPHCGGGGGGGAYDWSTCYDGGSGGSNGGSGGASSKTSNSLYGYGGSGGSYGGGRGGNDGNGGYNATFYGSGGGGGGVKNISSDNDKAGSGGGGYQGVIYIRIPVNQS